MKSRFQFKKYPFKKPRNNIRIWKSKNWNFEILFEKKKIFLGAQSPVILNLFRKFDKKSTSSK